MPVNIDIPYRCPNCGDQMKFSTLHELRSHLENEHSYHSSRSRRRVTISDFDGPSTLSNSMSDLGRISPLLHQFHADTYMLEEQLKRSKEEELNNKKHRASSAESLLDIDDGYIPMSKNTRRKWNSPSSKASFRTYGLPSRVSRNLDPHSKKRTNREHSGSKRVLRPHYRDDDHYDDSNPQLDVDKHILEGISHRIKDLSDLKSSFSHTGDKHMAQTLHALSKEVMIERASQQATAESLYSANETLYGVERAAEQRIALQQRVIENLAEELKDKEKRLTSLMQEMDNLREQQTRLKNANVLNTNLDFESKHLQQELSEKQKELDALARNVERSKQFISVDNLKDHIPEKLSHAENTSQSAMQLDNRNNYPNSTKENSFSVFHASANKEPVNSEVQNMSHDLANDDELKSVKQKAQQLEKDRHSLLLEMQSLLETAAVDNEKLRQELHNQEHKLSRMNLDLKSSKHEQAELLGETHELYHQADVGLTKLKMMLKERDRQLSSVSSALEQAREIQQNLVHERDESLKQAAEREGMYRAMLAANSDQLKTMKDALASNQESKHTLEMNLRKVNYKLESKGMEDSHLRQKMENLTSELRKREEKEAKLKSEVQRREEKLKKAKSEMERMTDFLKNTAEKESSARMKLEGFISKLLERAEKAESELRALQKDKPRKSKHYKKRTVGHEKLSAELARSENSAMNFELHPAPDSRHDPEYDSGANLIATYPQESEPGTRPSYTHVPDSIRPQNPFYLHRPRRQTYNNAASMYNSSSVPTFGYDTGAQSTEPWHFFQNTPEVDRMMRNVEKQKYLSSFSTKSLKDSEPARVVVEKDPGHPSPSRRGIEKLLDFSIDDDGIMWERHATPSPHSSLKLLPNSVHNVLNRNVDDTDVGEELSDFVYDDEQKSHEESEDPEHVLTKSKRAKEKPLEIGTQRQNEFGPSGKDDRKMFLVSEPFSISSAVKTNSPKNVEQGGLQNDPQGVKGVLQAKSSDGSPLHKAKEVQRRVEEWTSARSGKNQLMSSAGFDADNMGGDSDFSTSSYASFKRTREPPKNEAGYSKKNEITHVVDVEPVKSTQNESILNASPSARSTIMDKMTYKLNESEPAPVVEEQINVSSQKERLAHKFAGQRLKRSASGQYQDNYTNEINDTKDTPYSLPVEKAPGEKVLLSQAEMSLQEDIKIKKGMPKWQISIIENGAGVQGESIDEDLTFHGQTISQLQQTSQDPVEQAFPEDIKLQRYKDTFLPSLNNDTSTRHPQDLVQVETKDNVAFLGSPEQTASNNIQIHITQNSDTAENAETGTEIESTDEFAKEKPEGDDKQASTLNKAKASYHSSEEMSSSEEEMSAQENGSHKKSALKQESVASVDASTDTDLEKLSQPGHVHRGLSVRKNTPVVRHIYRKKPKKVGRSGVTQESVSSADELDNSEKAQKKAAKDMRVALFHIFSYLETEELLSVSLVCKQWCKTSRHPALWKRVLLHYDRISSKFLFTLSEWCTKTEYLSLKGLRGRGKRAEEDEEEYKAAIRCIWLVSGYCRLLTKLTYNSSMDPIHSQLMWALGGGCPGITSLFVQPLHPCSKTNAMNNKCLLMISQFYRDLQEIGMGGKEFDVGGLMPLVQACQHLRHMTLEHCLPVTADLVTGLCRAGLKQLQTIAITGATVETKALQTLQSNCRQLKKINIKLRPDDFIDDLTNKKEKEKYKKMVKNLEGLRSKAAFAKILYINAASVD
ncbi:F-box only protein 41 [Plakobranchus ocellatus]|uniref:F-box only protein 41 n=1 Tax=Plakobranchus ocellatus TaxID=259542 RepID=A0AAV4C587_9GAST|nr:F-box only protein 41 [Plakobranchus ocellatus]